MIVPRAPSASTKTRVVENSSTKTYIRNVATSAEVISPDDSRVKLTETMKKACEGRPIFYHSQHIIEPEEEFKLGVTDVQNKDKKMLEKMLPKRPKNQTRGARTTTCEDKDLKASLKIVISLNN